MNLLLIFLSKSIQEAFKQFGYLGIFVWFITVDQIAPVPEEITLIIIGYFVSHGLLNPVLAGLFAVAAFLTVDSVYFYLTKTGNSFIKKFTKKTESHFVLSYKKKLKGHLFKTLLILCFIPRMRLLAPVYVALLKIPYKRFILFDALSLGIFTAVYISLGIIFHSSLAPLISKAKTTGHIIFISAMVVMTFLTIFFIRKLKSRKA